MRNISQVARFHGLCSPVIPSVLDCTRLSARAPIWLPTFPIQSHLIMPSASIPKAVARLHSHPKILQQPSSTSPTLTSPQKIRPHDQLLNTRSQNTSRGCSRGILDSPPSQPSTDDR